MVAVEAAEASQQQQPQGQSKRDSAMEDEIFHCGYFADVTFRLRGLSGEVEEVYGQRALFSLLSPVLRGLLLPNGGGGSCDVDASVVEVEQGRLQVTLGADITSRGFREVARYVYRLPWRLSLDALPEVLLAARRLGLEELEESALAWGLAHLGSIAAGGAGASPSAPPDDNSGGGSGPSGEGSGRGPASGGRGGGGSADTALRCLERLCTMDEQSAGSRAWQQVTLQAFTSEQVLSSAAFLALSPAAMRGLLLGGGGGGGEHDLHADPCTLWRACLDWARALAGPPGPPEAPGKACAVPRRLFGHRGTRLAGSLAPAVPGEAEVAWQEPLLSVVDLVGFYKMSPKDFAAHVEALDPILPQLRQAIYTSRRQGAAKESLGEEGGAAP